MRHLRLLTQPLLVAVPLIGLASGFAARLLGHGQASGWIWAAATLPVLAYLLIQIATSLWRGEVGLDVVAALSMAGALVVGEHLAAIVVTLMYAGGQYLESYADRRARREMTKLLSNVPRTALRHHSTARPRALMPASSVWSKPPSSPRRTDRWGSSGSATGVRREDRAGQRCGRRRSETAMPAPASATAPPASKTYAVPSFFAHSQILALMDPQAEDVGAEVIYLHVS